jgi:SAM-dependent methyltransferase
MAGYADQLNSLAWGSAETVERFARRSGFFSPGEARVMQCLAARVCGQPILDIGVGGGRTTGFLCRFTADYIGIDYLAELVEAARARFPQASFEQMDARDLSRFGQSSFWGVVFSLNGIDGMSHDDRATVFSEVHRVLKPGGWFAYSTLNLAYAGGRWRPNPLRTIRHPRRAAMFAQEAALLWLDRRRLRGAAQSGSGWATSVNRAYGRPVIWHRVTSKEALAELRTAGFDTDTEMYTSQGINMLDRPNGGRAAPASHPESPELHILARRP